ncbi:MAG: Polyketide synthase PksL [Verrucomicrobia subdivision 3 bacterium]|nr:Polyketide synthase PksL [Limisphaerales bacterium]MCS1417631.1 Polyketide synthase PksL [Limisphaerales bacterium]
MKSVRQVVADGGEIAVIGMACRFPGASDYRAFWRNLAAGISSLGEVPKDRWDWRGYGAAEGVEEGRFAGRWGGFLEDVDKFDAGFFSVPPREAVLMDPQQRVLLELAWACLEDAGYVPGRLAGSGAGVFIGICNYDYKELLDRSGRELEGYFLTGTANAIIPNRISQFFDFHGPSISVDTACSSSLVALDYAVKAIRGGDCGVALAGGVNLLCCPQRYVPLSRLGMLSPTGRCRSFDAGADGYVRGEGAGLILLKALAEAQADGDDIIGVIKESGVNHGGRSRTLTSPNVYAQSGLLVDLYSRAGVGPETIGYLEAHGTGTLLGDPIEVNGLKRAFGRLLRLGCGRGAGAGWCGLGAVKSNIGHLESAAGIAGVIKALLCLRHRQLVPTAGFRRLNPKIRLAGSPFYIVERTAPWGGLRDAGGRLAPRRAGVSSFGFGGANAHVILEERPPAARRVSRAAGGVRGSGERSLILLSARDEDRLRALARGLVDWLGEERPGGVDLAYTLQMCRAPMAERLAFAASDGEEVVRVLRHFVEGGPPPALWHRGKAGKGVRGAGELGGGDFGGDLDRAAAAWAGGMELKGPLLPGGSFPKRLSLPAYPFARERYWFSDEGVGGGGESASSEPLPGGSGDASSGGSGGADRASDERGLRIGLRPPGRWRRPAGRSLRRKRSLSGVAGGESLFGVELGELGAGVLRIELAGDPGLAWDSPGVSASLDKIFRGLRGREDILAVLVKGGAGACRGAGGAGGGGKGWLRSLQSCEVPLVGVLDEGCAGAGWWLACVCDLLVCSSEGVYGSPGVSEVSEAERALLAERFGGVFAAGLLGLGGEVSGSALRGMGLRAAVVAGSAAASCAERLAGCLAERPRRALVAVKRCLSRAVFAKLDLLIEGSAGEGGAGDSEAGAPLGGEGGLTARYRRALETFLRGPAAVSGQEVVLRGEAATLADAGGGVAVVRLHDEVGKNAFTPALRRDLLGVFERVGREDGYKVVVLRGHGRYFSSGGTREDLLLIQEGRKQFTDDAEVFTIGLRCELPVIGAMQGHALGAGWALGMFCDLVLFAEESVYDSPYLRYGFTPGAGSTLVLAERLGWELARGTLLVGRGFKGAELGERGMVWPVFPREAVCERAIRLARVLAAAPRSALIEEKAAATAGLRRRLPGALEGELAMHRATFVGNAEVRERICGGLEAGGGGGCVEGVEGVREALRGLLAEELRLGAAAIDDEAVFVDLGLDSVTGVTWLRSINRRYGLSVAASALYDHPTLNRFAVFIAGVLGAGGGGEGLDGGSGAAALPGRGSGVRGGGVGEVPVAVVGMAGQFPGARSIAEYWGNIAGGRDCIREVPPARWSLEDHYDASGRAAGKSASKWMGVLEDADKFDPLFFNLSPREAEWMDPQQRLFLESCWQCIEDAGYAPSGLAGACGGVFAGCAPGDYAQMAGGIELNAQGFMGGASSILASRISYLLDLRGPALAIDTACSASLVAVAKACDSLVLGQCEWALAGGVCVLAGPSMHVMTSKAGMLSPQGRCFVFDRRANGFVPGEGVGVVMLKRLADAQREGDPIHGVIRGWGVNQDGRSNGITAPSGESQARLVRGVYDQFDLHPETIGLVEAHGTGTELGDPIEFNALAEAFGKYTRKEGYCALGSVKSNVGHLLAAAGVAGLIKVLLSLKRRQLPPTIQFERANEHICAAGTPFFINTELREWEGGVGLRRGAVSAFGFSGTNAHVVLEEAPGVGSEAAGGAGPVVLALSARRGEQLREYAAGVRRFLLGRREVPLGGLAYTLQRGREVLPHRLAVVGSGRESLARSLAGFLRGEPGPECLSGEAGSGGEGGSAGEAEESVGGRAGCLAAAGRWVRGGRVDWESLQGPGGLRRWNGLPTCPFARESYWLAGLGGVAGGVGGSMRALVDRGDCGAAAAVYCSRLKGDGRLFSVCEAGGGRWVGGLSFLELARFWGARSLAGGVGGLRNVVWGPLISAAPGAPEIRTVIISEGEGVVFQVLTASGGGEEVHGFGELSPAGGGVGVERLDLAAVRLRSSEWRVSGGGGGFQSLRRGEGEVLAGVDSEGAGGEVFDAGLMACAWRVISWLGGAGEGDPLMPFSLKSARLLGPGPVGGVYIHVSWAGRAGPGVKYDLVFCDGEGRGFMALGGLAGSPFSRLREVRL